MKETFSQDPIGFAAGDVNQYRYVGNEATGAVDPSGLLPPGGGLAGGAYDRYADGIHDLYRDKRPPQPSRPWYERQWWNPAALNARLAVWWTETYSVDLEAQYELNAAKQRMAINATAYPNYDCGVGIRDGQRLGNVGHEAIGRVIQLPVKSAETIVTATDTVFVVYVGANLTRNAANAAAVRLARRGGLVHMTEAGGAIRDSRRLGLPSDLYAGPASNARRSGWPLTARTGLNPRGNYEPVFIPYTAESAFSRPLPLGPFTLWQRATGQQYAARGIINLETGEFMRTGFNRTQASWYIIDAGITGTTVAGSGYCWSTTDIK